MLQWVKQIEKLHKDGNYEDISCILTDLHEANVTLDHLQSTDIAICVYQLLKTCHLINVRRSAKGLLSKWKRLCVSPYEHGQRKHETTERVELFSGATKLLDQKDGDPDSKTSTSHKAQNQEPKDQVSKGASTPMEKTRLQEPMDPETVSSPESSTSLRAKCVELLLSAMNTDHKTDLGLLRGLAQTIETHIYTTYGHNVPKYKSCIRSRIANLKNKKSPHLRHGLLTGTLTPDVFARMSAEEMAGEDLRQLRQVYTEAGISEHQMPHGPEGTPTTKVRCQRCEGTDCRMTQISRGTLFLPSWVKKDSADENTLTFMTCSTCGAQWYHNRWVCV